MSNSEGSLFNSIGLISYYFLFLNHVCNSVHFVGGEESRTYLTPLWLGWYSNSWPFTCDSSTLCNESHHQHSSHWPQSDFVAMPNFLKYIDSVGDEMAPCHTTCNVLQIIASGHCELLSVNFMLLSCLSTQKGQKDIVTI